MAVQDDTQTSGGNKYDVFDVHIQKYMYSSDLLSHKSLFFMKMFWQLKYIILECTSDIFQLPKYFHEKK